MVILGTEFERSVPPQPILRTDRLLLRPFRMADAPAVRGIVDNESVASMTRSITLPYTVAMAKEWIQPQARNWFSQSAAVFAVCWTAGETTASEASAVQAPTVQAPSPSALNSKSVGAAPLVGAVGLEINEEDEKAELGYWVAETFWGRGVATEAATAMVRFGFEMLCLNKIFASHMVRNPASGRVLEKIGMRQEGVFRDHVKKGGRFEDAVVYGILAAEATGNW